MNDQGQHETISLQQLFTEELTAVNNMLDAVGFLLDQLDMNEPHYAELHNERMMLEQTRLYLIARIEDRIPHTLLAGLE